MENPPTSFVSTEEPEIVDADGIFTAIQNALISLNTTNADISDEEYSKKSVRKKCYQSTLMVLLSCLATKAVSKKN